VPRSGRLFARFLHFGLITSYRSRLSTSSRGGSPWQRTTPAARDDPWTSARRYIILTIVRRVIIIIVYSARLVVGFRERDDDYDVFLIDRRTAPRLRVFRSVLETRYISFSFWTAAANENDHVPTIDPISFYPVSVTPESDSSKEAPKSNNMSPNNERSRNNMSLNDDQSRNNEEHTTNNQIRSYSLLYTIFQVCSLFVFLLGMIIICRFSFQILGLTLVFSIFYWIINFRGGFGFSEPKKLFNWHPMLNTIGFIFLFANCKSLCWFNKRYSMFYVLSGYRQKLKLFTAYLLILLFDIFNYNKNLKK